LKALVSGKRILGMKPDLEKNMRSPLTSGEDRFRLTIPLADAFAFSMGWSDLGYVRANDAMRLIVGLLVVDTLEYSEQWRTSARVQKCLLEKWPGCFCFEQTRSASAKP
jgi:hypothetical protein